VKLVLDTNVMIPPSWRAAPNELGDVLEKKFSQRAIDVRAACHLFAETFTLVTPDPLDPPVCRDRDDDVVLATAGSARRSSPEIRIS
jgi:predicted nucleic acid-binding protein